MEKASRFLNRQSRKSSVFSKEVNERLEYIEPLTRILLIETE